MVTENIRTCVLVCLLLAMASCQQGSVSPSVKARPSHPPAVATASSSGSDTYGPATVLGTLEDSAINESSGLVASRTNPGLYWTHNDSGDGPFIYAFDDRGGRRGVWRVTGAGARDWEDIAAGPGPQPNTNYLYIGDIGDNGGKRGEIVVYRIPEPPVTSADVPSSKREPSLTATAEVIRFSYPDGKPNAEALMVHPQTGDIYIVTKAPFDNPAIYQATAPVDIANVTTLKRVGELNMPGFFGGIITGGDISPDGRQVALCDYVQGYEIALTDAKAAFSTIWQQPLTPIGLGNRKQGEALAYRLDGKALLATSEGPRAPLIQVVRR
ncbi:MAG: hypothetical protein ABI596_02160 [Pyrinomonadaceae bacterium]